MEELKEWFHSLADMYDRREIDQFADKNWAGGYVVQAKSKLVAGKADTTATGPNVAA